ncbi:MAG: hypothetical protein Q8N48_07655 [Thiobacillus sp.]|nr:hypothetical protein [Thiobacillus sp.]MDP2978684.1 hypothetical protein [Thiobacillus sp.]
MSASLEVPWYRKTWLKLVALAGLIGWVLLNGPTAIDNLQILPSKIQSAFSKVQGWYHTDSVWTAKWTNEGEIDIRYQPDVYMDLDIIVSDDGVGGTITSSKFLENNFPFDFMLIRGEQVNDNKIQLSAYDYIGGVLIDFAKLEGEIVTTEGVSIIHLRTIWQAIPIFPLQTELWRASASEQMIDSTNAIQPTSNQSSPQPRRSIGELQYRQQ